MVSSCLSPLKNIFHNILTNIKDEFSFRIKNKQKHIIEEFLAAFNVKNVIIITSGLICSRLI